MKKYILVFILVIMAQSTFAIEPTSQTIGSVTREALYSTAITSVTSEISSFSLLDVQKQEAQKIQSEVQDYNQTGEISLFLGEKMSIINQIDPTLSNDEIVDVLLETSEVILLK